MPGLRPVRKTAFQGLPTSHQGVDSACVDQRFAANSCASLRDVRYCTMPQRLLMLLLLLLTACWVSPHVSTTQI